MEIPDLCNLRIVVACDEMLATIYDYLFLVTALKIRGDIISPFPTLQSSHYNRKPPRDSANRDLPNYYLPYHVLARQRFVLCQQMAKRHACRPSSAMLSFHSQIRIRRAQVEDMLRCCASFVYKNCECCLFFSSGASNLFKMLRQNIASQAPVQIAISSVSFFDGCPI